MWAVAQLRPVSFGGIVAFGKKLGAKEAEAEKRFRGYTVVHDEDGKIDAWDHWHSGDGEQYLGGKFL